MGGAHMVTAPHPLHANTTTATLWITREATAILNNLALLAATLTFGNLFLYQPPSLELPTPTPTQAAVPAALFTLAAAAKLTTRALTRTLRLHTPGAITPTTETHRTAPDLTATTISTLCTWAALAAITVTIPAGNWATPGVFITLGIATAAAALGTAGASALKRRFGHSTARVHIRLESVIFGISLIVAGGIIYQAAMLPTFGRSLIDAFVCFGILIAIGYAAVDLIREAPPATGSDPISTAATELALRNQVAPTITDRQHAQKTMKRAGRTVITALVIGAIVSEFIGMPWPLIVGAIGCAGVAIAAILVLKGQRIGWKAA